MINRRQFLTLSSVIALNQLISSCSNNSSKSEILLLQGTIPAHILGKFRKEIDPEKSILFKPESQLKTIFELLKTWQNKGEKTNTKNPFSLLEKEPQKATLVTLGDFWLKSAISQNLIEPLKVENIPNWSKLPPKWQQLVKRNNKGELDNHGLIWGAPYRWGTVMIAYREDKFKKLGWYPQDWEDLWKPEIKGYLSLLNQPREIVGLTLKKLGYSYNNENISQIPQLEEELKKLHKNVKFYDSKNYLQPLVLGDIWISVGWSNDILPLQQNNRNIKAIIPKSGTSLWADLWVKPIQNNNNFSHLTEKWIDFCWQEKIASEISFYSKGSSPIILGMKEEQIPKDIINNKLLYPDKRILEKSEFLLSVSTKTQEEYENLILNII